MDHSVSRFIAVVAVFACAGVGGVVMAGPASTQYELLDYSFGAGGTPESVSGSYSVMGILGEQSGLKLEGAAYDMGPGLVFTLQASVPPAPAFTNPGATYDRLKLVIDPGGNPADSEFAVAITDDGWVTTNYIQSDFTVGASLGDEDWMTYSEWGSATGNYITGLKQATTYRVKVKARSGNYTEYDFGPEAVETTSTPSITFGIDSSLLAFSTLNSGNAYTDDSKSTVLTTSTNAYYGYTVYAHSTGPLTFNSSVIADFSGTNGAPLAWSGTGFGYTTNDSDLGGGTPADRFIGPSYAGFTQSTPGDPVADHIGPIVETPIVDEAHTVSYRVTASDTVPAGSYVTSVRYIVVPEY